MGNPFKKVPWKKVWSVTRVILGIAIDLNDAGLVKIKELDKAKKVRDVIDKHVPKKVGKSVQ